MAPWARSSQSLTGSLDEPLDLCRGDEYLPTHPKRLDFASSDQRVCGGSADAEHVGKLKYCVGGPGRRARFVV